MGPLTGRPHGYARYKLDNCRCYVCAYACATYNDRRNEMIAAGTWEPFTDAGPVRAHVLELVASGVGYKRTAAAAGLAASTVGKLLYTDPPRTRVRSTVAAAILAVRPDFRTAADRARIPSAGTTRRIRALACAGHSLKAQAEECGWTLANFSGLAGGRRDLVSAATARAVADLYDRWWAAAPAGGTVEAERVRAFARRKCWLPSLAWDDDTIDDPSATACVVPAVDDSDPAVDDAAVTAAYIYQDQPATLAVRNELIRRLATGVRTHASIAEITGTTAANVSWVLRHRNRVGAE